jgi:malate dehydrogenase
MLRLDHNRALSQLAAKTDRPVASFKQLTVWGNHSPTMYADYRNCTSNGDNVKDLINDPVWNNDVFLPTVGKRGAAIIDARGLSSAASAANAAIDHMRDWVLGSDEWVTMGVPSDGSYDIRRVSFLVSPASARAAPSRSSRVSRSTATRARRSTRRSRN